MFLYLINFSDGINTYFFDKNQALDFIKNKSNVISFTEFDIQDAKMVEFRVNYNHS